VRRTLEPDETRIDVTTASREQDACPICHEEIAAGDPVETVPVCPLVYPQIDGLVCHSRCLAEERERNRFLRREDLAPTFLRRRVADG
jgi:hypothetical protein